MNNTVELESKNIVEDNIEQLKKIFPNIVKDGKIDFDTLKLVLGEEVEQDKESYKFEWSGKNDCYKTIQSPSLGTLKPLKDDSVDFDNSENLIIEGDNLEVLKLLQSNYGKDGGQIKMIYIDPPYNTGNEFLYPDDYNTPLDNYFEQTGQTINGERVQSKKSKDGRKHTQWLNMIYPRLMLSRNILTHDGVIFISIDDNEIDNLKKVCNDVFGEENFISQIMTVSNPGGRDYNQVGVTHEYLLVYGKSEQSVLNEIPKDKSFELNDNNGGFELRDLRNRNPKFHSGNRPNLFYPFYINPNENHKDGYCSVSLIKSDEYSIEVSPYNSVGKESVWRWGSPKSTDNIIKDNPYESQVVGRQRQDGSWNVYEKSRKSTTKVKSIWDETKMRTENGTRMFRSLFGESIFDHPKSVDLIKRIIKIGMTEEDIVLDFFGGSGTTGQSVLELNQDDNGNRKFILVQLPEKIDNPDYPTIFDITKERIRRVINGYGDSPQPINDGFKVFKLDKSNYVINEQLSVNPKTDRETLVKKLRQQFKTSTVHDESLVKGYTNIDIIYEIIIKEGYNLNSKIEELKLSNISVFKVTDNGKLFYITFDDVDSDITKDKEFMGISKDTLFVCFDNNLSDSTKDNLSLTFLLKTI